MDSNSSYYFYSTIAQCVSAIVALLGVFIIHRLQSLSSLIQSRAEKITRSFTYQDWRFVLKHDQIEERISNHVDEVKRSLDLWSHFKKTHDEMSDKYLKLFESKYDPSNKGGEKIELAHKKHRDFLSWKDEFKFLLSNLETRLKIIASLKRETYLGLTLIFFSIISIIIPDLKFDDCTKWIIFSVFCLLLAIYLFLVARLVHVCFPKDLEKTNI